MTQYRKNDSIVDAYQHQPNPNNDTVSYPQWFLDLIVTEQIRPMPDGSVHVDGKDGFALPLPIGYWLIREVVDDQELLSVVAPDAFAAEYIAV